MFYWMLTISVGTFLIGYMVGLDRGFRNAHKRIVAKQFSSNEKTHRRESLRHLKPVDNSHRVVGLRLLKSEDEQE